MTAVTAARSSLHPQDILRIATVGLRTRRLRAYLSALGIAIGIAAMVAVLGISESSRADLLSTLDRLGTNLLTAQAGGGIANRDDAAFPATAETMLRRIGPVQTVASVTSVDAIVLRNDFVSEDRTGGLSVTAADLHLLDALGGQVADGEWLDSARSDLPVVVLGAVAAERLGITDVSEGVQVWIGDQWFSVIGILEPVALAQDIDRAALIGRPIAARAFDAEEIPEIIYLRIDPEDIDDVRAVTPATANPADPDQVEVSRPSDAIEARAAAATAYTSLFLGLGGVALLVGGVGVANVMVISVLERRAEIGLRRALGATRRHISLQFLSESLVLSLMGGVAGVALGALISAFYALSRGWPIALPVPVLAGGIVAALAIGAIAGLYPATRAARLSPTEALRSI
jgi:putative ABC transport system permease protein